MRSPDAVIRKFERLLRREAAALRAARLGDLPAIVKAKEDFVAAAPRMMLPERDARRLRDMAAQNAVLLQAVMLGLQSAISRIDTLRGAGPGLVTYDKEGRRQSFGTGGSTPRRA